MPRTEPGKSRRADLGRLPFTLTAAELHDTAEAILADARRDLEALVSEARAPTVERFLAPLNDILVSVRDVSSHGGFLLQVHPDDAVRRAGQEASEAADRFLNEFRLNERAYAALGALDLASAEPVTTHVVEKMRREMRRAGVERAPGERKRLVELTNQIDRTSNEFNRNIADGARWIEVDGPKALQGLPTDFRSAHPADPRGKIRLSTRYPDAAPVLTYCDAPEVRREMLRASLNVADPENREGLHRLLAERWELAHLLGYPDYATFILEDKMLERPEAVDGLIDRLGALLARPAGNVLDRYLARKHRDLPEAERLDPWDGGFWGDGYYDTKLRREEHGVDLSSLRAYLPYPAVRDGLFRLCEELFGLTFRPASLPAAELWHPTVEAYDVERDGRPMGRCYLDLVARPGKYNHAAQFDIRTGVEGGGLPQAALVCNFLNPDTPPDRARLEYSHVITFFHEFGHLVHALFSGHGRWLYATMSYLEWDFVEAPSQLFEEWARDPATLARFARDPESGRRIPSGLLEHLEEADAMSRACRQLRQVVLAAVSLELYQRDPTGLDASATYRAVWDARNPMPMRPEYHPESSWGHLTDYSACYYTYVWSNVIARDLLTPFRSVGSLTDRATAERYAREILAPGSSRKAAELIRRFLGREFSFGAYEAWALAGTVATPVGAVGTTTSPPKASDEGSRPSDR